MSALQPTDSQNVSQKLKVLKIVRLLRLTKMLRLARVKRVLKRLDEDLQVCVFIIAYSCNPRG